MAKQDTFSANKLKFIFLAVGALIGKVIFFEKNRANAICWQIKINKLQKNYET
jgi:hypothetical protein